ncbi:MAG: carboxypeptidase-like regulatory domain-containing protein [Terriglobales bacterium]
MRRWPVPAADAGWRVCALAASVLLAAGAAWAQANRTVRGTVLDARNHSVPQAVVYIVNTQTQAVQTYITGPHGHFYFHALAPNTNYRIYAVFHRHRSKARNISAYDTRAVVRVDLTLPIILR